MTLCSTQWSVQCIGVARIFSGVHFFFLKKFTTFFLSLSSIHRLKTASHTHPPTLPAHQQKFEFLLCMGVHLQLTPTNYALKIFLSALGVYLHPCTAPPGYAHGALHDDSMCCFLCYSSVFVSYLKVYTIF